MMIICTPKILHTVLVLIELTKFAVPVNWFFDIIPPFFAKFNSVVYGVKPGETPSNSASPQASSYMQRFLNSTKYFKALRCGCNAVAFNLSIYLGPVLYFGATCVATVHTHVLLTCPQDWCKICFTLMAYFKKCMSRKVKTILSKMVRF